MNKLKNKNFCLLWRKMSLISVSFSKLSYFNQAIRKRFWPVDHFIILAFRETFCCVFVIGLLFHFKLLAAMEDYTQYISIYNSDLENIGWTNHQQKWIYYHPALILLELHSPFFELDLDRVIKSFISDKNPFIF